MIELNELLTYQNPAVLKRYEKDYPQNKLPAEEAFSELMKFIWLCLKHKHDKTHQPQDENLQFNCIMHYEMREIDDMWHTFLLYTRDYHQFCETYFNTFFHHDPATEEEKNIPMDEFELKLTRYLSYIYDHLGEETVRKWFGEMG